MAYPFFEEHQLEIEVNQFIEKLSDFFNQERVENAARTTEFVQRKSKLTGLLFLSIFTFGMSIYGKPSLAQLVGLLNKIMPEIDLSREALHSRINENAVKFFEYMLSKAINIEIPKKFHLNIAGSFKRILILDSTSFELPEQLSDIFKGSGGNASDSAVKIQFCYDLKSGQFFYMVEDGTSPDNKYENSFVNEVEKDDLIIRDLGYFNKEVFVEIAGKGGYYLSRWKTGVSLYVTDKNGKMISLDIVKFLRNVNDYGVFEIEAYLYKKGKYTKTRFIIEKVPDEVKKMRLRKINQANKRKGRTTSKETKVLQGFNLHISNASAEKLPSGYIRTLYGVRWQVELVFKNWKSNFRLDSVSGLKKARIECMLYAKLLFIFISTNIINFSRNLLWLEQKKEVSDFKATRQILTIADKWLEFIILEPKKIQSLLTNTIRFIMKRCFKIPQKDRAYPLELLDKLFDEELSM